MKLVKRRKPLVSEPFVPTAKVIKRKYRSGTLLGKIVRYMSEHKYTKKFFAANLGALVIVGSLLPGSQNSVQAAPVDPGTTKTVIQTQNTLVTERSIQYPLVIVKVNQGYNLFHPGVDLGGEIGDSIEPVKAGIVIEADYSNYGYGNTVLIDHGKGLTSRYAHLNRIEVKVGEEVTTNKEIGTMGVTGRSTGPHLHLEVRQNSIPLNPMSVLSR